MNSFYSFLNVLSKKEDFNLNLDDVYFNLEILILKKMIILKLI